MFQSIRAVAIVLRNDHLLVIKRQKGSEHFYVLPGGGVEEGETVEEAVVREIAEEASLEIKINRRVYLHYYTLGGEHDSHQEFFLCDYVNGEPALHVDSEEMAEMQKENGTQMYIPMWLSVAKLPETLLYPLEIRDWLIEDIRDGFKKAPREAHLRIEDLRQSL